MDPYNRQSSTQSPTPAQASITPRQSPSPVASSSMYGGVTGNYNNPRPINKAYSDGLISKATSVQTGRPQESAYNAAGKQTSFDRTNAGRYLNPLAPSASQQGVGYGLQGGGIAAAKPAAAPAYDPDTDPNSIMNQYASLQAQSAKAKAERASQQAIKDQFQQQYGQASAQPAAQAYGQPPQQVGASDGQASAQPYERGMDAQKMLQWIMQSSQMGNMGAGPVDARQAQRNMGGREWQRPPG